MISTKLFIVLALISISAIVSADIPREGGVLVLGQDNFQQAIKDNQYLLVEFYAPWCGHCKKLEPEFVKAAEELAKDTPPMNIAKVDATQHGELAKSFEVQGYPTLKFFVNGTPSEYNGGRTAPEIVSWLRKKTGPPSKEVATAAEVEAFHGASDAAVVFFGNNDALFTVYENVARSFEDISFAHCKSEECMKKFDTKDGQIVLFKKFDNLRDNLTENFDATALTNWINANSSPLVMKFDQKCAELVFGKAKPGLFFYRDANASDAAKFQEMATAIATELQGKLKVIVTGITEGLEQRLAEYIGVTDKDLPSVRIHDTTTDLKKYNMEGEITIENVRAFVAAWEAKTLKPHLKSEEIPATNDAPVKVLVGKNFNDIVMDTTKDVMVEFYAPWCGHCKKLAPIYDELAAKLQKSNPNIVIAKMDSTLNEVESVQIQGFPTIKFWPAGNKAAPVDYEGDRDLKGFLAYFEKHVSSFKKEDL